MTRYIVTGTSMVVEADDEEEAVSRAQDQSGWHWEAQEVVEVATDYCKHCGRNILLVDGTWVDPEATGDDAIWRETCEDNHEEISAPHEPKIGG